MRLPSALLAAALLLTAAPLAAYTVFLKDGSTIAAREAYVVEGDKAIITLQNGTKTSIDASEIDVERTRRANLRDIGSAVVIEDGQVTELPSAEAAPRRETLSDVLARRQPTPTSRPTTRRSTSRSGGGASPGSTSESLDFRTLPRRPFRDLDVAGEVQRLFRGQGVEEVLIYQGSQPARLLLDVTANSEASVFRSLEVAADTLVHLTGAQPGQVSAFELVLATAERDLAGQFLITPDDAAELASDGVETSAFFVDRVRF